ncbi:MAG: ABC transporter substrate-binding protein [Methanotrichaceae archaeon]
MSKPHAKGLLTSISLTVMLFLVCSIALAENKEITLKAGMTKSEFTLMNPMVSPWYNPANEFYGTTHVGLATFSTNLTPLPCLARKWTVSPDGKSIKFTMVKNAKWEDGAPVTSDDVKFTYEYWRDKELYREGGTLKLYLDNVEVLDNYSGVVHLKEPYAYYFVRALFPTVYIIPKHIWEKVDDPTKYNGKDAMIGCGPFIFESYDKDADTATLKANENYFEGKPSVDKIVWRHFRDVDSMLLSLKKGEIDVLFEYKTPTGIKAESLESEKGVKVDEGSNINLRYLIFGYKKYPMNMTKFREAVSYAIDYQSLVDSVAGGYGVVPRKGLIPSASPDYKSGLPLCEYNITKANLILDSLNFKDTDGNGIRNFGNGSDLKVQLLTSPTDSDGKRIVELLSHTLKKAGIDAEPLIPDATQANKIVYTDRSYDLRVVSQDPYMSSLSLGTVDVVSEQYGTCDDPEYIKLYRNMMAAKDDSELKPAAYALQDYYAKEMPAIPLYWYRSIYLSLSQR